MNGDFRVFLHMSFPKHQIDVFRALPCSKKKTIILEVELPSPFCKRGWFSGWRRASKRNLDAANGFHAIGQHQLFLICRLVPSGIHSELVPFGNRRGNPTLLHVSRQTRRLFLSVFTACNKNKEKGRVSELHDSGYHQMGRFQTELSEKGVQPGVEPPAL